MGFIPIRVQVAIMMFFACWVNYMMRVNISVNIIAMVPVKSNEQEDTTEGSRRSGPDYYTEMIKLSQPPGTRTFDWSEQQQYLVLSGYFWGYAAACGVGGVVSELYGPKRVITISMVLSSIMTMASPACAGVHYLFLFVIRILCGVGGGFLYPALHDLVAHWSPPAEKGRFISALLGGAIGTAVTWSLSGPLIVKFGWGAGFYLPGACALVWCCFWWFIVYDSPVNHPRISEEEKKYIVDAIGDRVSHTANKITPPVRQIITSSPFIAMAVLHFGSNWGLYFIMTAAPKFIAQCLKMNLTNTGPLASLPYIARMTFSLAFGSIGDIIIRKNLMRTVVLRKFFTLFSHIIPGLLLAILGYVGNTPVAAIALITISLGFNGAACLTNLTNHQDLAPNFAGTLYGFANAFGNCAGFITPLVTGHFTKHGNGFAEWRPVFLVGASIYIGAAIYFIIFGSASTQKWNFIGETKKPESRLTSFLWGSSSTKK